MSKLGLLTLAADHRSVPHDGPSLLGVVPDGRLLGQPDAPSLQPTSRKLNRLSSNPHFSTREEPRLPRVARAESRPVRSATAAPDPARHRGAPRRAERSTAGPTKHFSRSPSLP